MANPGTIAGAGLGASIGGTILSAFGAAQQGKATSNMYTYQAGVSQAKKAIDLQNRDYALATGERESEMYGMKARNTMGKIRAGQSASGIDIGGGSSVAVRKGQQQIADIDSATIRNNTARKAYGFEVEAASDEAQANLYGMAASDVKRATKINVATSLLSGASSVSSKWLQGRSAGVWGS